MGRVELFHQEIEVWISIQDSIQDNKSLCDSIEYNMRKRNESIFREQRTQIHLVLVTK